MRTNHAALLAAALATAVVFLQGCGAPSKDKDLVESLCADATAKAVESTDLVHEHLVEIQETCANETDEELLQTCENEKIAGIDRAEGNISTFYTEHCVEHVKEALEGENKTLDLIHTNVDKFETTHTDEIKDELHAGIHLGIEEGKADDEQTAFEIVCTHEVEKEVHSEEDLVHDHLEEIEVLCMGKDDVLKCEEDRAIGVVGAVEKVITKYTDHCKDASTWSLWAVHPAVDNFAKVHKKEIEEELHEEIHEAMNASGSGGQTDMISALCSDATAKAVESTDLVHKHLDEIQETCKKTDNETDADAVKTCEDDKIAGIDAAENNISTFYTEHCVEHVKEALEGENKTLDLIHTNVDKFETTHTAEITNELHDAIHRGIEDGKAGEKTALEIVCTHEVEKEVEDAGLIHEHLEEMVDTCKDKDDIAECEEVAAKNIIKAKQDIISRYVKHCSDPTTWTLWAVHPAVDNFAVVHKDEMKTTLHNEIDEAIKGLKPVMAAFLVPHAPVTQGPSLPLGAAGALLVMVSAGLAAIFGAAGLGFARLARQRAPLMMDHQHQESDVDMQALE
jgi:CRISPR/Cas system CMR-associated protein Cmr1 (group 7 of RAMP superfamily)